MKKETLIKGDGRMTEKTLCKKIIVGLLAILFIATTAIQIGAEENRTVRVGFYNFEGYHEIDESGRKSGYGYEYLQQIAALVEKERG